MRRREFILNAAAVAIAGKQAFAADKPAEQVLQDWFGMILELVRHTATYTPPVASRAFAYLGVTAYEAVASGDAALRSMAGQLNGLTEAPRREAGLHAEAVVLNHALTAAVGRFFWNTGPTGQRALKAMTKKMRAEAVAGVADDVVARSEAYGAAIADHVFEWSRSDGGAEVANLGFPVAYQLKKTPASWVPTSTLGLQQLPLLPEWGNNRPFALKSGGVCPLLPPPEYSEDPSSEFYKQAMEVYLAGKDLTEEHRVIARFWSDDPMLSPTPPGHWIGIALQIADRDKLPLARRAECVMRVGIAIADGFIACWKSKYEFDLLRPVTYIRRVIDKAWTPLLITPPFPEFPSGHSTQSAAAAAVLTSMFGEDFSFTDATHERDGIKPRSFKSFDEAALEAGISRLYGGIHFRAAIERGLDQGRCVGAFTAALRTKV